MLSAVLSRGARRSSSSLVCKAWSSSSSITPGVRNHRTGMLLMSPPKPPVFSTSSTAVTRRTFSSSNSLFPSKPFAYIKSLFGGIDLELKLESEAEFSRALKLHNLGHSTEALLLVRKRIGTLEQHAPYSVVQGDFYFLNGFLRNEDDSTCRREEFEKAMEIWEWVAPDHPLLTQCYSLIGKAWEDQEEWEKALSLRQKALTREEKKEPRSEDVARCQNAVGEVLFKMDRMGGATQMLRSAVNILQEKDPGSLTEARYRNELGWVIMRQGNPGEALRQFKKALLIRESSAPNSTDVAYSHFNTGIALASRGDLDGSIEAFRKAIAICESACPDSHRKVHGIHALLGTCLKHKGDLEGALKEFRRVLEIHELIDPDSAPAKSWRSAVAELESELEGKEE